MNGIKTVLRNNGWMMFLLVGMLGQGSNVDAKQGDCWVDLYEYAEYIGDHIRIDGPAGLANLRSVNGENWEAKIDSLKIGPSARVTIFEHTNYKLTLTEMAKHPDLMKSLGITEKDIREESELIFDPNDKINHLGIYNFHKKTKSLKIECVD
jgi:hypothetical protein